MIRNAVASDLDRLYEIEVSCFPKEEAASKQSLIERFQIFPGNFLVMEKNQNIIGFINGSFTDAEAVCDAFYHDATLHQESGSNACVFGISIIEEYRGRGLGSALLEAFCAMAKHKHKKAVILTCKEKYIPFYEHCGFICLGISSSSHGNAVWYDMIYRIKA